MKKTILTYGLLSGAIMISMMLIVSHWQESIGFDKGEYFGYATIILGFTLIFFGIRSYRKNNNETVTFWKAFGIGIGITTICSVIYVVGWMVVSHFFMPNFYQDYSHYYYEHMKASGATPQQLQACQQEMNDMMAMVKNPLMESLLVFIEPFPIGLLVTFISAFILKKKPIAAA